MRSVGVVLVGGTWSFIKGLKTTGEWYQDGSEFIKFLLSRGIDVYSRHRPFYWSSRLNGLPVPTGKLDWQVSGQQLWNYVNPAMPEVGIGLKPEDTNLIGHSHALAVMLYALALGMKANMMVSVAGPIREDMLDVAREARKNVKTWIHLCGGKRDRMQWLGELFDGHVGIQRAAEWKQNGQVVVKADKTIPFPECNHSDLLCTPEYFHHWEDAGILAALKQEVACG